MMKKALQNVENSKAADKQLYLLSTMFSGLAQTNHIIAAIYSHLNPLPDNKILALSKLKAFADDNFQVAKAIQIFLLCGRKHCMKWGKCLLPAISPFFLQCFQKASFSWDVKTLDSFVRG